MSLVDVRTPMTAPLASFSGESVVWNQPSLPPGPIVEYSSSPGSPVSGTRCSAVAQTSASGSAIADSRSVRPTRSASGTPRRRSPAGLIYRYRSSRSYCAIEEVEVGEPDDLVLGRAVQLPVAKARPDEPALQVLEVDDLVRRVQQVADTDLVAGVLGHVVGLGIRGRLVVHARACRPGTRNKRRLLHRERTPVNLG